MKKLTLQQRITLLTALILAVSSIALTVAAMANAEHSFITLISENFYVMPEEALPVEPYPAGTAADGQAATQVQIARQGFNLRSIVYCVIFTALGSIAVYYMAGKALSPLRELSRAAATIDEHTLSQRLPEAIAEDEVGMLTDRFNDMLSRLEDAFLRQKRFTANAAHELKTPLATMKIGMQVISSDPAATLNDYQENAKSTVLTINRMSSIVNDLLLLASAGENVIYKREEVVLEVLFDAIQSELALSLEQREIQCTVNCRDLSVMGNASMLYRAFFNLMENACKYGKKGGHIWITAQKTKEGISVSVKDDGPGIGSEHLPYLFDAFYRVDKSRSREMGGAGLGLSIVKSIIEASGGSITVNSNIISSNEKNGTCFSVILPVDNQKNSS